MYQESDYSKFNKYITLEEYKKYFNDENTDFHYSQFKGKSVKFTTPLWYLHSILEIFETECYAFESDTQTPFIIDCGANLGLSIFYFKQQHPNAEIIGFEPDPYVFSCLSHNCSDLSNVTLQQKAIWIEDTTLEFFSEKALGGCISTIKEKNVEKVKVQATTLLPLLTRQVDFLKIDIEGAEYPVLNSIKDNLSNVKKIFIEYHGEPSKPQMLPEILTILKDNGFRVYITEGWKNMEKPFMEYKRNDFLFDLQLNIFAYRL